MISEDKILEGLNEEQERAVRTTEIPVRVVAGAGSGKTRALTNRFAYLVSQGIPPGNILCVTFTRKAAWEMKKRIRAMIGDNDTGYICTFHGLCVYIIKEFAYVIGYPSKFKIIDNADITEIMKRIFEERGLKGQQATFKDIREYIGARKNAYASDYYHYLLEIDTEELKKIYEKQTEPYEIGYFGYLYNQKKVFGLDYNDLLNFAVYIFEKDRNALKTWQDRIQYAMVDEFQDVSSRGYKLLKMLTEAGRDGEDLRKVFVVGDADQVIYSWRGAKGQFFMKFEDDFPAATSIYMMKNYRSTPEILNAANALISKNKNRLEKEMIPVLEPSGKKPIFHRAKDDEDEALYIAKTIKEWVNAGADKKDIAILYRGRTSKEKLENVLKKEKIPYTILGGISFYERKVIKDAVSYMRLVADSDDDLAFLRIYNYPKRKMGEKKINFIKNNAGEKSLYATLKDNIDSEVFKGSKARSFVELIEKYREKAKTERAVDLFAELWAESGCEEEIKTSGDEERRDNIAELMQMITDYELSYGEELYLEDFLEYAAMFMSETPEEKNEKVKLMTIHTSKGMEFPYVIICGMSEGSFPSGRIRSREEMEEERRIAFVAMTRAEKELVMTMAEGYDFANGQEKYPSRFIFNILNKDPEALILTEPMNEEYISKVRESHKEFQRVLKGKGDMERFVVGDRVESNCFGKGTITDIDISSYIAKVKFDDEPITINITHLGGLKKIKDEE